MSRLTRADAPTGPLNELYESLSPYQGKDLDLAKDLKEGRIRSFFGKSGDGATFVIATAKVSFPDPYEKLTVEGSFIGLGLGKIEQATVTFTLAEDKKTVEANLDLCGNERFGWSGAQWLTVVGPQISMQISESESVPTVGTVGIQLGAGSPVVALSLQLPGPSKETWLLTGTFPEKGTLSQLFQLVGGVNLAAALPSFLQELRIESVSAVYDRKAQALQSIAAELKAETEWSPMPEVPSSPKPKPKPLTLKSIGVGITVYEPAKAQSLAWIVTGELEIGGGLVDVTVSHPESRITAALRSGNAIDLSEFVSRFVGHELDLGAKVVSFDLERQLEAPGEYLLSANLDTKWTVPTAGLAAIEITGLAFEVTGAEGEPTAEISGVVVIGETEPVTLTLSAGYEEEPGWKFSATETAGKIQLVQLIASYLPSGWQPDPAAVALDVKDLAISVTPKTKAYSISGTVDGHWDILGGFQLEATASIESDGEDPSGKLEAVLEEAFGAKNIGLHVRYSFGKEQGSTYELEWNGLTGTYTIPKHPEEEDRELKIEVKGWSLGRLIEELVSLATGARFSLASPWDLLDDVPLDCTLTFTMPPKDSGRKGTISFAYPLSIDIGIAALREIAVTYDEQTKKVKVQLDGRFPWQTEEEPLKWDAADPASPPAPPGSGNKYLELRTLGLGQHVARKGPPQKENVKTIVESVGKLVEPEGDKLPTDTSAITYSEATAWLIAANLGILKLDSPEGDAAYFLDAQLLFQDPDLYGLHLRLAGAPAKIFAGLEIDISYRKVTDAVGVYQAELQLPSAMRQFDVGAFSFTLPLLALAVYTNGDFEVDIGFPWNFDFSRSFTVQGIVPPGIPVIGAGGLYFGKLSAETAGSHVPTTTKGSFNPVIIFGIGLQVGAGKTFQKGPLSAGLTITLLGVVQGVVARWHPNLPSGEPTSHEELQDQYYFKLQGTLGLAAHMYGSIDFAVIKASVEVNLEIRVMITYESYRPIPIEVNASVEVKASLSIDLGLFTIHLHFSFSTSISESFTVGSLGHAPWDEGAALAAPAPNLGVRRMRMLTARSELLLALAAGQSGVTLTWSNLQAPSTPLALSAYMTPAFSVVGDDAATPAQQSAACVLLPWIESVDPNAAPTEKDTSFEALAKQVLRWTIAAAQSVPVEAAKVDNLVVSDETLGQILAAFADPEHPLPIKPSDVDTFLERNAKLDVRAPSWADNVTATYFPMPPQVELKVPSLGIGPYSFEKFQDVYETAYITHLREYFSELDVQVEEETPKAPRPEDDPTTYSMASIVYAEYFGMMARQMVEAAREGLRDLKLPVPSGETVEATVAAINAAGDLAELGPAHLYTVAQLLEANAGHPLNPGKTLRIARPAAAGDTLATIAAAFPGKFSTVELATANKTTKGLLLAGTAVNLPGRPPYVVEDEDTLEAAATKLGVSIAELVETKGSNLPGASLGAGVALLLPTAYTTQAGDTLAAVAARFGVPVAALGLPIAENGRCTDLFTGGETPATQFLDVPHLPRYRLGDLIAEAKRSLAIQRLSGMLARYFLHGLRLPEQADKSKEAGLFALTGQQLPLGQSTAIKPFDIELSCPDTVSWLELT